MAVCLLAAGPALADTLDPGKSMDLTDGVATCETDILVDPLDNTGVSADATCDGELSALAAKAVLEDLVETAASATGYATLAYNFDVSFTEGTKDNPVKSYLVYEVGWAGAKLATADGQAAVDVMLKVYDVTGPGDPIAIVEQEIHSDGIGRDLCTDPDCLGTAIPDVGDDAAFLTMTLLRGHSYKVTVGLMADADLLATAEATDAISDYMTAIDAEGGGVLVDFLIVAAEVDIAELAAQVEENTENIEELQEDVGDLQDAVMALEDAIGDIDDTIEDIEAALQALSDRLDELEGDFEGHTHTYLTGRGVGHNNTEAETGPEIDGDDVSNQPVPEPLRKNGRAKGRSK
jgi:polyhydroxyalkanoate synthesis regulator phasin